MNPREFCRLQGYQTTLLLTYTFDPLFFERLALPDLLASGSSEILICADGSEIDHSKPSWLGQVMHLGRRYQLIPISVGGAFHPKIIIKANGSGGAVWVGSANITYSGWSVNRELGTAWTIGPDQVDSGAWLKPLLAGLRGRGAMSQEDDAIERLLMHDWLAKAETTATEQPHFVLSTFDEATLAAQLAARWSGRSFQEAKICTGSTDARGRFLQWLHETFGISRATVLVDPGRSSFDLDELAKLPLEVDVRSLDSESPRPMHAKFIWLEGGDGPAACFGSANCSAAAWTVPYRMSGNDELVVVYDTPSVESFKDALGVFEQASKPVQTRRVEDICDSKELQTKSHRVVSSNWDPDTKVLLIQLDTPLADGWSAIAAVQGQDLPCSPPNSQEPWLLAKNSEGFSETGTIFGDLYLYDSQGVSERHLLWINHLGDLRHASRGKNLAEALHGFTRARSNAERHRYLKSLHQLASELLTNPEAFRDPKHLVDRTQPERGETDKPTATPIDPNQLVQSLKEIRLQEQVDKQGSGSTVSMSLTGVFRLLFESILAEGFDDELNDPEGEEDESDKDENPNKHINPKLRGPTEKPATQEPEQEELDDRVRSRLVGQVEEFLDTLSSSGFAEAATATQMVQAIAYILGLTQVAKIDGWATPAEADLWSRRVIEVVLIKPYQGSHGLIRYVQERYEEEGNRDSFRRIVGDGTVWAALLAVLSNLRWDGPGGFMEQALTLHEVFRDQALLANTNAGKLSYLVDNDKLLRLENALNIVPKIDDLTERLEKKLRDIKAARGEPEDNAPTVYTEGDLMWRQAAGWAVCRSTTDHTYTTVPAYLHKKGKDVKLCYGWYWNVNQLAEEDKGLSQLLLDLKHAFDA